MTNILYRICICACTVIAMSVHGMHLQRELNQELLNGIYLGKPEIVKSALQHGADPNTFRLRSHPDEKALHIAIHKISKSSNVLSYESIIRMLLHAGADVNSCNEMYGTPLHIASRDGLVNITRMLIKHGALINVDYPFRPYETPLHTASNNAGIDQMLMENGADLHKRLSQFARNKTSAHTVSNVEIALKYGADPNALDYDHNPVLPQDHDLQNTQEEDDSRSKLQKLHDNRITQLISSTNAHDEIDRYTRLALGQGYWNAAHTLITQYVGHTTMHVYTDVHLHTVSLYMNNRHDAYGQQQLRNILHILETQYGVTSHYIRYMVHNAWDRIQECTLSPRAIQYLLHTYPHECMQYRDMNNNTILHVMAGCPHAIEQLPTAIHLMLTTKYIDNNGIRILHSTRNSDNETPMMLAKRIGNREFCTKMHDILEKRRILTCHQQKYTPEIGRISQWRGKHQRRNERRNKTRVSDDEITDITAPQLRAEVLYKFKPDTASETEYNTPLNDDIVGYIFTFLSADDMYKK